MPFLLFYTGYQEPINMRLTLQLLTGTKYFVYVTPEDKVRNVKVDIFKELEIKSKVRLMWQNKPMDDCVTLRAIGINEDATVQMIIEPDTQLKLTVETLKKGTVSVVLNDSSTVRDLVKKLSTTTLKSTARTSEFNYEHVDLSDENLPFHFYGITDGSIITQKYEGSFKVELVNARSYSHNKYITVRGSDTIKDLTEKVLKYLKKDNLFEDYIVIFHKEKLSGTNEWVFHELDKETWTLAECSIQPLCTITFIRYDGDQEFHADIKIEDSTHKNTVRVYGLYPMESVQSLKLKIQHQHHIPYEKQLVSIRGMSNPVSLEKKLGKEKSDKGYSI